MAKVGGRREGAGRPPGAVQTKTRAVAIKLGLNGLTPLEVMVKAMRYYADQGDLDKAASFAKDAAPYMHPRLASVEHGGQDGKPIRTEAKIVFSGVLAKADERV